MRKAAPAPQGELRRLALVGLVLALAVVSLAMVQLIARQVPGADFACFWAGAKVALSQPARLYDFRFVTDLQGWPLGPTALRPYINPPSALLVFAPLAWVPYWIGYGLWIALTGAAFTVAGRRTGAPWWFMLLPSVALVAFCGQLTFLIGALAFAGLASPRRPVAAGVLFGIAAAVKPQLLVLLPVALLASRAWVTLCATAVTGLVLCALATAVWGVAPWLEWLSALGRFHHFVFDDPALTADAITPYAALMARGAPGAWAFLLAPVAAWIAWEAFRRPSTSLADRGLALFGGAFVVSPHAMNYELALLAPAVASYLARTGDRGWWAYAVSAVLYVCSAPILALAAALGLPAIRLAGAGRRPAPYAPEPEAALSRAGSA